MAIIWQTLDGAGRRGIVAFGRVVGSPEVRSDETNPFWKDPEQAKVPIRRARVEYVVTPMLPLWADEHAVFRDLSVYRSRGGAIFNVTPEQLRAIVKEAGAEDMPVLTQGEAGPAVEYTLDRFAPMAARMKVLGGIPRRKQSGSRSKPTRPYTAQSTVPGAMRYAT